MYIFVFHVKYSIASNANKNQKLQIHAYKASTSPFLIVNKPANLRLFLKALLVARLFSNFAQRCSLIEE